MLKKITLLLLCSCCVISFIQGQTIKVGPYLQNASPNSIHILWETNTGTESIVEWGVTTDLGNTTSGTSSLNLISQVHDVKLEGLTRFTEYYYRVRTDEAVSEISKFKTPPFASDNESFRIVAMSDMQRDDSNPSIFEEMIEDGVIDYLENEVGGELIDNLALVLIPGDLVENGLNYAQWEDEFFDQGAPLFKQVPVYPVPGNHEVNTTYFFNYFHLPENGTAGFEEHWWYKDYGNTRIIGMDSNFPFDGQDQLDWLDDVLNMTCASDSIDFVFAQLHHPHKSELWLPGESDFTGDVITRLENFSTNCAKPSIHFFGHTHGYSRGQSRDHKHLWINVASAGGALDNWGEFPQFDYDEFSVSQDEWGFLAVEVTAGDEPSFTVKRISRGNESLAKDNEMTDSLTVRLEDIAANTPSPIFPLNEEVKPDCVILKAGEFSTANPLGIHGQSHWQVSTNCNDFSNPVAESWKNYENHYYNVDTQLGDDLTDEKIIDLDENTSYCWRVRYRDREMNWSEWSQPASFTTIVSAAPENLLLNPGAESDVSDWISVEGNIESLTDGECNGISPYQGGRYFAVGGICDDEAYGRAHQDIDVSNHAAAIDNNELQANYGAYLSNYNGNDIPEIKLLFLDENNMELGSTSSLSTMNSSWTMYMEWVDIPPLARTIRFVMIGTRNNGQDNDSYFDELFLAVGNEADECEQFSTTTVNVDIPTLDVVPNPWVNQTSISIPFINASELQVTITNTLGQRMSVPVTISDNEMIIKRGALVSGTYFFIIHKGKEYIGQGKFIVRD